MAHLIAIEGLDGSGKETQTRMLRDALQARGLRVSSISFPRYGQTSAVLAEEYLRGAFGTDPDAIDAYGASSFFAVDRYASYLREWREDYEQADVLIADRYATSNAIHQCSKLPQDQWDEFLDWAHDFEMVRLGLPKPDQVIYLHLPVDEGQRLLDERYGHDEVRKDIHEHDVDYLRRSQQAAEYCATRYGWDRVECMGADGVRPAQDIHEEVVGRVTL